MRICLYARYKSIMEIKIQVKQLGRRRAAVAPMEFVLDDVPTTVRQLIDVVARAQVAEYNDRAKAGGAAEVLRYLTKEEVEDQSDTGKVAFGVNYNGKTADADKAVENAVQCYEDDIFRIFVDNDEAGAIDDPIMLSEGCSLTFVRLTMLAGRMW